MKRYLAIALASASLATAAQAEADKEKLMQIGKQNFVTCMACHGPDGTGLQVGPMKMAPTMAGSKFILADPEVSIKIVLKGIAKEDATYAGVMAPLGAALDDEKLAGVLTYVRNSFGNSASVVTPEMVAKVREETKDDTAQLKRADLEKMVAGE